ncbi:hypothetical protein [Rhizobium sp. NZLR11]|uniref:hypothetical protein n=1 Tax=Rhizobium sp. NZLR11 TaxID=2731098 RepID=UPI001C836690|nr:hypothetical protein [Rhizobium sp. NZLR11]MBX5212280.1 hypothetical protein [Rhizobium sp. NZLR11]
MLRPTLKESHLFVRFITLARPRGDCERVVGVISLDWPKHAKAAPFKRNDQMLDILPIGVMHFPGTGIQGNLPDKAKKLRIPVCERLPLLTIELSQLTQPAAAEVTRATPPARRQFTDRRH